MNQFHWRRRTISAGLLKDQKEKWIPDVSPRLSSEGSLKHDDVVANGAKDGCRQDNPPKRKTGSVGSGMLWPTGPK